jgi:hypothetical protein
MGTTLATTCTLELTCELEHLPSRTRLLTVRAWYITGAEKWNAAVECFPLSGLDRYIHGPEISEERHGGKKFNSLPANSWSEKVSYDLHTRGNKRKNDKLQR